MAPPYFVTTSYALTAVTAFTITAALVLCVQDLLICAEMAIIALAHTRAFPVAPYLGGTSKHSGHILEDHFAYHSGVRDFNEVMPVLLPSRCVAGAA